MGTLESLDSLQAADPDTEDTDNVILQEAGNLEGFLFTEDFFTPDVTYNTMGDKHDPLYEGRC